MELTGFAPIIRRWLGVILIATFVAAGVGLLLGSSAERTYEARAELLVGPLSTDTDTMRASGDLGQTYAELATTDGVLSSAARRLDVPTSELRTGVRATANSTTRFLVVRARSHDPKAAAAAANAVAAQLLQLGKQDPTRPEGQLRILDPARPPSSPVSPRLGLIVPLAALAGLLGAITLVLLFEFVGDTAESADKVEAIVGAPTIAVKRRRERPGADLAAELEPYRIIATDIDLSAAAVRCVLITGVTDDDGTAGLARRLGAVWARRRGSVTVLDASTGELILLTGPTAGGNPVHPVRRTDAEAITYDEAAELRDLMVPDGGLMLVFGQPATVSAATLVWARVADATVLSVRRFQARRSMIREAVANLAAVDANLALAVLHERPGSARRPWSGRDAKSSTDPARDQADDEGEGEDGDADGLIDLTDEEVAEAAEDAPAADLITSANGSSTASSSGSRSRS